LAILVTHIGYYDTAILCPLALSKHWTVEIRLRIKAEVLDPVILQPPPVWKRGDTTFFKADHFKRGNETRLKDLIAALPGFTIAEDGTLSYKNKQINKILINGQDLFADKPSLLLNNFPVHVLNTIQAIENQNNDRLLQGLGQSTNTVLNLSLTSKNKPVLFGATEAGIGTMDKYSLNPVVFCVSGKVKLALIGHRDNIGAGVGLRSKDEMTERYEKEALPWMMQPVTPMLISSFETKWFIDNNETDAKLQLNFPVGKKVTSRTELGMLADRQDQNTFYNQSLIAVNGFLNRIDTNTLQGRPKYNTIDETLEFYPDSSRLIRIKGRYFEDLSSDRSHSTYTTQGEKSSLNQYNTNRWNSMTLKIEYIRRRSPTAGNKSLTELNIQNQDQSSTGLSPQWAAILGLDSGYSLLSGLLHNHSYTFRQSWYHSRRLSNGTMDYSLLYDHAVMNYGDSIYASNAILAKEQVYHLELSNLARYQSDLFYAGISRNIRISKKENISFSGGLGLKRINSRSSAANASFMQPQIYAIAYYSGWVVRRALQDGSIAYRQQPRELYQMNEHLKPISIRSFDQNKKSTVPIRSIDFHYGLNGPFLIAPGNTSITFDYRFDLTSPAIDNQIQSFFSVAKDSMVRKPLPSFSVAAWQELPSVFLMGVFKTSLFYGKSSSYVNTGNGLARSDNKTTTICLAFRKKVNKLYTLLLSSEASLNQLSFPNAATTGPEKNVYNIKSSVWQVLTPGSHFSLEAHCSLFHYNISQGGSTGLLFMDARIQYKLKALPFSFACNGENLTNQTFYNGNFSTAVNQSFYKIPLVPRKILFSIRYEF
jgi:hypothetical protein